MGGLTLSYVIRRLGMFFLTVWIGATLIFIIPRLAPGDPIAAMVMRMSEQGTQLEDSAALIEAWRVRFGLDGPWYVQYGNYLRNLLTFDMGYSLYNFPSKVETIVGRALPWTFGLLTIALIISFVIGNVIGALLAWRKTPGLVRLVMHHMRPPQKVDFVAPTMCPIKKEIEQQKTQHKRPPCCRLMDGRVILLQPNEQSNNHTFGKQVKYLIANANV